MLWTDTATAIGSLRGRPLYEQIDAYGLTHAGKVRKTNQDHFMICSLRRHMQIHRTSLPQTGELSLVDEPLAYLAMVADGVGSGQGGDLRTSAPQRDRGDNNCSHIKMITPQSVFLTLR